ncbi:MAG TPA: 30S ribosomal protein S17 [Phycisphaerae bacterium]|nr:30S ribosomal protein S17 [Phycisphaerales bacterium]HNO76762.1 30S ribosomal protein S17 [Phycisphaerae bacterium]
MAAEQTSEKRSTRRIRQGVVVSDSRDKTIKVTNSYSKPHPKYGKIIRRSTTLHAHDEKNEAHVGDLVEVMACRPISKQKSWRLVRIVQKSEE